MTLAAAGFFGVPGCSSAGRPDVSENTARPGQPPVSMTMTGTLRDLEPAIRFAATHNEMAILDRPEPNPDQPDTRRFDLVTVVDEPVTLTIRLSEGGFPLPQSPGLATRLVPAATPLEMTASIRIAFGYPERERAFLTTLRDRLRALEEGEGIAKGP